MKDWLRVGVAIGPSLAELEEHDRRITARGARRHSLKNISVEIPRHTLAVVTDLSGSGKSSWTFDIIYKIGYLNSYLSTL
jgi:excinuclease ABC subunit A